MRSFIERLVDKTKRFKVFKRNKKSLEVRILSGLLYFFELSLRKTSLFMSLFEEYHMNLFVSTIKGLNIF